MRYQSENYKLAGKPTPSAIVRVTIMPVLFFAVVTRACDTSVSGAYLATLDDCNTSGYTTVCYCGTDLCNSGYSVSVSIATTTYALATCIGLLKIM
jgi:hypothetical protein